MTIGSTDPGRWDYVGNGVTVDFAYEGQIYASTDLKVYLDGVLQSAGYTVSGVGGGAGGNVTFGAAPASGVAVATVREIPETQEIDFVDGDDLPSDNLEKGLDKATLLIQQLSSRLKRTLQLPESESTLPIGRLPVKASRASMYLAFDAAGDPIALAGTGTDVDISDKLVTLPGNDEQESLANLLSDYGTIVNVRAFGATGDGATDDGQAIEDAVDALAAGDTLYFPPGTYNVAGSGLSGAIVFAVGNVRVLGAGADRTSIVLTGTSGTGIFRWSNHSGIEVAGIKFVGDNSGTGDGVAGSAIYISLLSSATADIADIHIHDCVFSNFRGAGWLRIDNQDDTYDIARVRIERNRFSGGSDQDPTAASAANQIYLVTGDNGYIEDYWIVDNHCDANSVKMGISVQAKSRRGHVSRNTVLNAGQANSGSGVVLAYGISVYNGGTQVEISDNVVIDAYTAGFYILDPDGFTITGNYVSGQEETSVTSLDRAGIAVTGGNGNTVVSGNSVADCYRGIMLRPGGDDAYTVTGNHIENCTFGLVLRTSSTANFRGSVISGNHIEGTTTAVEFHRAGTTYFWRALSLVGNRIKGATGITGYAYFEECLIAQNLIHATSSGMVGDSGVVSGSEFGLATEFADNVIYGDLSGYGFTTLNSGPDMRVNGLTIRDISTGVGWRCAGNAGTVVSGVAFVNVSTPTATTASLDTGIEDPAGTWTGSLPENGAFVQKLVPTEDGNGRVLIGWRLVAGAWEDEFVSTATWA